MRLKVGVSSFEPILYRIYGSYWEAIADGRIGLVSKDLSRPGLLLPMILAPVMAAIVRLWLLKDPLSLWLECLSGEINRFMDPVGIAGTFEPPASGRELLISRS